MVYVDSTGTNSVFSVKSDGHVARVAYRIMSNRDELLKEKAAGSLNYKKFSTSAILLKLEFNQVGTNYSLQDTLFYNQTYLKL